MLVYPSGPWAAEWIRLANASDIVAARLSTWEGDVGLVIEAEEPLLAHDAFLWFEPADGRIDEWEWGAKPRALAATIVLTATYSTWKTIVRSEVHPVRAILRGSLRVRSGRLSRLLRFRARSTSYNT